MNAMPSRKGPTVGDILKAAMVRRNMKQVALSQKTNVPQGTISRILAGKSRDPKNEILAKLAAAVGLTTAQLRGEEDPGLPATAFPAPFLNREDGPWGQFTLVPTYDIQASAGPGATVENELPASMLAFRRDWVHGKMGLNPNRLKAIQAEGDSMFPAIHHGDLLLMDADQTKVGRDGVYVLRQEDQLLVKRVSRRFDGSLLIQSDNDAYPDQEVPADRAEEVHVVGRVVWIGRNL